MRSFVCFFFHVTATSEIYTLSLRDALPISARVATTLPFQTTMKPEDACAPSPRRDVSRETASRGCGHRSTQFSAYLGSVSRESSEEHTSELQSRVYLVCRLLLEKKKCLAYLTLLSLTLYTIVFFNKAISPTLLAFTARDSLTSQFCLYSPPCHSTPLFLTDTIAYVSLGFVPPP